jgi:hypothetical protein
MVIKPIIKFLFFIHGSVPLDVADGRNFLIRLWLRSRFYF